MKNLIKIAFMAITVFLFSNKTYAQINVTKGANYYVCQGEAYTFDLPPTGVSVATPTQWEFDSSIYTCSGYCVLANGVTVNTFYWTTTYNCPTNTGDPYYYGVSVTLNTPFPVKVTVIAADCSHDPNNYTFTITPYVTSIIGDTGLCGAANVTYTATTNGGIYPNTFSWTLPPFLSGSSSTDEISVSGDASLLAYGNISVTSNACPVGSASNSATLGVNDVPSAPTKAPGGTLTYEQHGRSCWWDAYVPSVPDATQYQWSFDSTFAPIIATTGTPVTTNGPFFYDSYIYTVYVRGINECGNGPFSEYKKETPPAPEGCLHKPIDNDTSKNQVLAALDAYKVYPNPAGNQLTIEYPKSSNNKALSFVTYDMLGQKVASWNLQASESSASVNTSLLPAGLYLYEIVSGNALLSRGKLMIQR